MAHPRRQFNTTLLPDGRVLATGGTSAIGCSDPVGTVHAAEVWDPATGRWAVLASSRVTRVTLVRLGSVTHGFDQNQRFPELGFRRAAGGLSVSAPVERNLAPPGDYLLFILSAGGVPSVAKTLRIG